MVTSREARPPGILPDGDMDFLEHHSGPPACYVGVGLFLIRMGRNIVIYVTWVVLSVAHC